MRCGGHLVQSESSGNLDAPPAFSAFPAIHPSTHWAAVSQRAWQQKEELSPINLSGHVFLAGKRKCTENRCCVFILVITLGTVACKNSQLQIFLSKKNITQQTVERVSHWTAFLHISLHFEMTKQMGGMSKNWFCALLLKVIAYKNIYCKSEKKSELL